MVSLTRDNDWKRRIASIVDLPRSRSLVGLHGPCDRKRGVMAAENHVLTAGVSIALALTGLSIIAILVSKSSNSTGVFTAGGEHYNRHYVKRLLLSRAAGAAAVPACPYHLPPLVSRHREVVQITERGADNQIVSVSIAPSRSHQVKGVIMSLFTNPNQRRRFSFGVIPGLADIAMGIWGVGSPQAGLAMQNVGQVASKQTGVYQYHQGDLFTPGTGNWAFEPSHDGPVQPIWGAAFLRQPNTFNPIQHPQQYTYAAASVYGLSGQIAGQIITQPLSEPAAQ